MAQYNSNQVKLDDTELLLATIEAAATIQGHTEYMIKVQRGHLEERNWRIRRRYNDFAMLHNALQVSGFDISLPPKKLFGNMDRDFISVRQRGLQNYLNTILSYPILSSSLHVKRFLDPVNYLENFQEKALQHVFMMFRCEPNWSMVESLPDIGWRLRRQYYMVKYVGNIKDNFILSWCEYGPDFLLNEKELALVVRTLTSLRHPYIASPKMASNDKTGGAVIYSCLDDGTLRDHIYKSKPTTSYLKKYSHQRRIEPLSEPEVVNYGKQILEALKFLHEKGFLYGHLHTGNVLISDGICQLAALENSFIGLSSIYRTFLVQLRKVKTLEDIDVYAFGHVMFEMTFGESLKTPTCDNYFLSCSPKIKSVLESILTMEACKGGLPSVEHLLMHPLFAKVRTSAGEEKGYLKLTTQSRECMRAVRSKIESRLSFDQKTFRQVQRLSKVNSVLSEEKNSLRKNTHLVSKKNMSKEDLHDQRSTSPTSCTEDGSSNAPTPPPNLDEGAQQTTVSSPKYLPDEKEIKSSSSICSPGYGSASSAVDRSLLLASIHDFDHAVLRKAVTKDCSQPKL